MKESVLTLNAGSSSVKFSLYPLAAKLEDRDALCKGACQGIGQQIHFQAHDGAGAVLADKVLSAEPTHAQAVAAILDWVSGAFPDDRVQGVGHRVVHGGPLFTQSVRVDALVLDELQRLVPLVPLHQPHNLAAIAAAAKHVPEIPQFASFDTTFHRTQPPVASVFALPGPLTAEGIRRYGFHGLSYQYIADILPQVMGASAAEGKIVVAHLGSGASLCAIEGRKSIATTMSFTALDGLPMSTRCGNLDPGVVLYLIQQKGMTAQSVSDLLHSSSGLKGVSGMTGDMKALLESPDARAAEAVALFVYRVGRELGSLAAALGGLDALIFTAGIGERAPALRQRIGAHAAWLGLTIDPAANERNGPCISAPESKVSAWVIPTDEEWVIARDTRGLLQHA